MNDLTKAGFASALLVAAFGYAMPAEAGGLFSLPRLGGDDSFKGAAYDTFKGAPAPMPVVTSGRNCYWRLDAGASISGTPEGTFFQETATTDPTLTTLLNEDLGNSAVFDAGVGCSFGNGFRSDLVLSWRTSKDVYADPVPQDPISGKLSSHSLMANIYYDIPLGRSITPYVGAGLGVVYHNLSDLLWVDAASNAWTIAGKEEVNLAWSLMAGAAYQVTDRITLDVGYRYIDMGSVASERYVINGAGQRVAGATFDDITAHEIKAGVRVSFGHGADTFVPFK